MSTEQVELVNRADAEGKTVSLRRKSTTKNGMRDGNVAQNADGGKHQTRKLHP
jgi:hypothetical protein